MVEIIGLVTLGALVWLLAWTMSTESDSERRKKVSAQDNRFLRIVTDKPARTGNRAA